MPTIKRLLFCYLIALGLLCASVATNLFLTTQISAQLEQDASRINLSGRQRMLSQRIAYLAQDLSVGGNPHARTDLLDAIAEFERTIELFETSHETLKAESGFSDLIQQKYLSTSNGPSLDERVKRYIAIARKIAADPRDLNTLIALKEEERSGLLDSLDAIVTETEALSKAKIVRLQEFERSALLIAIVIVLLEVIFVFIPGHRLISRQLAELRERNLDLEVSKHALRLKNQNLQEKEAELLVEHGRLETALQESERLRKEQADFTYAVAHDLKSPSNTLGMILDELKIEMDDRLDEESLHLLDHGRDTIARMARQVEAVLAYAWSTERREAPDLVDLTDCAEDVRRNLSASIAASGAEISIASLHSVWGFRTQLTMLLQNLLENAIRYRRTDVPPRIEISTENSGKNGGVVLVVRDNGIGIAPEHHQRIFGVFQRLHRQDEYEGSGLGLSTCSRIARNHDGHIGVTSEPGQGACFAVHLLLDTPVGGEMRPAA